MSESPKSLAKKYLKIAAGGVVLLLVAWVGVAYYVSRVAAGPVFEVVQGIGSLEPFTSPLPRGSVALVDGDTVASLQEVSDLRPSEPNTKRVRIVRGKWLPSVPEAVRTDSALVGILVATDGAEQPVVVRLQPRSSVPGARVGQLILKPGERPIDLY